MLWVAKGLASNAGPRGCFTTRFASTVSAPDMVTRAAFLVGMRGGRFGFQAWGRAPIAPCSASPYEGPSDSINHRAGAGGYASYPLAAGPSPISSGDTHVYGPASRRESRYPESGCLSGKALGVFASGGLNG